MNDLLPYLAIFSPLVAIGVSWGVLKAGHGSLLAEMARVRDNLHALRSDITSLNLNTVSNERDLRAHEILCEERWRAARGDPTPVPHPHKE